ncbi:Non-structural maintenance of chromosomes element 1 like protein [Myotis davidii]|uniref:Non-structural maintenance of chromosomes element 1 like protein n=1 Tax=Myotis davidii TaxID=225400 RepID=L5MA02_MYODS|nr:Non-structural maintenance of chromosomes element 1 like protein [Myotis davidii]
MQGSSRRTGTMTDVHRRFLQLLMTHGVLEEWEVKRLQKHCYKVHDLVCEQVPPSPGPSPPHWGHPDLVGAISASPGPFQPHWGRPDRTGAVSTSLGPSRSLRERSDLTGAVSTSPGPS